MKRSTIRFNFPSQVFNPQFFLQQNQINNLQNIIVTINGEPAPPNHGWTLLCSSNPIQGVGYYDVTVTPPVLNQITSICVTFIVNPNNPNGLNNRGGKHQIRPTVAKGVSITEAFKLINILNQTVHNIEIEFLSVSNE